MRTLEIVHRTRYDYAEPVTLGEYRLMFRPRDSHDLRLLSHQPDDRSGRAGALDPRSVRQLDRHRLVRRGGGAGAGVRQHHPARALRRAARVAANRGLCPQAAVQPTSPRRRPTSRATSSATIPIPTPRSSSWARQFLDRRGRRARASPRWSRMCKGIQESADIRDALRDRHAAAGDDARDRRRHVPRLRAADDGGARSLGLAARFVTGYLYDPALDSEAGRGGRAVPIRMPGCEVYLPGAGWVEFDPTNGIIGSRAADPRRRRARSRAGDADQGQLHRRGGGRRRRPWSRCRCAR